MKKTYLDMKKNEKYIPLEIPNIDYYGADFVRVTENSENITFSVCCDKRNIEIEFKEMTPFYMYSEETMRMMTVGLEQQQNNDKFYFKKNLIYVVENSILSQIIEIESCGVYSDMQLKHYCIVTDQDVVDILSTGAPCFLLKDNE